MAETPLISVIVPVYNIEEYLLRCVRSIREQTYQNLEILLVDDGSGDRSGQICDELAEQDPRIRVFHKENGGSSSARNLGIENARGEYFGFVDSDDYIEPDMYRILLKGSLTYHVKIAQVGRDEIDEAGNRLPNICEPPEADKLYSGEDFLKELLLHTGDCSFCTKLLHRELFYTQRFPEGVLNEDFHLLVNLLPNTEQILSLPGQLYHVFYRVGSNTRKIDKEEFSRVYADCVDNADMVAKLTEKTYPKLSKAALRFGVFQRMEYLLHIPIGKMDGENGEYRAVVRWMRRNWLKGMGNSYLTGKNKIYLTLFAIMPKGIRMFHKRIKKL